LFCYDCSVVSHSLLGYSSRLILRGLSSLIQSFICPFSRQVRVRTPQRGFFMASPHFWSAYKYNASPTWILISLHSVPSDYDEMLLHTKQDE
jgi:hypothetical protein